MSFDGLNLATELTQIAATAVVGLFVLFVLRRVRLIERSLYRLEHHLGTLPNGRGAPATVHERDTAPITVR